MNPDNPIIFVVDDDYRVREALARLLSSVGLRVATFGSAAEFLEFKKPDAPACLILDLELPGASGLELQQELVARDAPPIVFITGHGDIPSSVRAMKAGAIEFLSKPFGEQVLLRAIGTAIRLDREVRQKKSELAELHKHYSLLTPREREVLSFVVGGFSIKQTASDLGVAENTIGVHRVQIMRKMGARSLAELVRMAIKIETVPTSTLHKETWNRPRLHLPLSSNMEMHSEVTGAAKHVVVGVDDDFRVRESIARLVDSAGYEALMFSSAEGFLDSGTLAGATCLITDVRMPGMHGIELQRRVRLERPQLPVIFITAHFDDEIRQRALDGGAVDFMFKPFDGADLLSAIDRALKNSNA